MQLPFRLQIVRSVQVRIEATLGLESARLGDLIQLLARSAVTITDVVPDRSLYHLGMPEPSAEVTFLVRDLTHKKQVIESLLVFGFQVRVIAD